MASLLLLIKTQCLSRHERDIVLCCICVAINRHVIVQINGWFYVTFRNHDGYVMATIRAMRWLHNEICDVLHRDNFVMKTNVNLIDQNPLSGHTRPGFQYFLKPFGGSLPPKVLYIYINLYKKTSAWGIIIPLNTCFGLCEWSNFIFIKLCSIIQIYQHLVHCLEPMDKIG